MASDGLTQWSRFDVPGMWSLLRNVSTADAYRQATAWQQTYEATQALAGRLQGYRGRLATKWPPETSEAARIYLGRLDELIGSAQQLADAAVSNRQALVTLADAVDTARPKMQRVYTQSQALRQVAAPRGDGSVMLAQQRLHQEATEIMESLGSAAMDSWRHYTLANNYQPPSSSRGEDAPIGAPVVDDGQAESGTASASPTQVALTMGEQASLYSSMPASGGTKNGATGFERPLTDPRLSPTVAMADYRTGWASDASPMDAALSSRRATDLSAPTIEEIQRNPKYSSATVREQTGGAGNISHALAPGGVIGKAVEAPAARNNSSRVAAPADGIGRSQGSPIGMMGPGAGAIAQPKTIGRHREYDPDDPWYVAQGSPPVLEPPPEPTNFDPGPGVFGIDR